jgi:predicted metal-binding membrane protein
MCGDMPMAWMPMPGQTWAGAAALFVLMWTAMMVPMMTPSLAPALWRYRRAMLAGGVSRPRRSMVLAAAGYFFVWALVGLALYPLGVLFAQVQTPLLAASVVLASGLVQLGAWKQRQLERCVRDCCAAPAGAAAAWLHGMHLGTRCLLCCGNLMAILLAFGMMDGVAMAGVTAAITLERLVPAPARAARCIGILVVGAGLALLARAAGV